MMMTGIIKGVLLLSLLAFGGGQASVQVLNTKVSSFFDEHYEDYLKHMKAHFDNSLDYLFTSNAFADQSFERPGMGKILREASDRHWQLGINALKKYLQRGGDTPDLNTASNSISAYGFISDEPAQLRREEIFKRAFEFTGENLLKSDHKDTPDFPATYLKTLEEVTQDSKDMVVALNLLHKGSTQRHGNGPYDADMAHFLEEKMEQEVEVLRKFKNLHTTLDKMKELGLARHFFDQHL
ncbi:uncharacterized protein LOC108677853 [Hyalella azteca]|uniref:Uncharacterized protein LOC108677853 n=1 Tax=Hyalella azteca TaxID=294128 RepID=A0A8B7P8Y9_HYAAZ|nr:uncharacterized protein LOC108677853 [Hyalella azteca]